MLEPDASQFNLFDFPDGTNLDWVDMHPIATSDELVRSSLARTTPMASNFLKAHSFDVNDDQDAALMVPAIPTASANIFDDSPDACSGDSAKKQRTL